MENIDISCFKNKKTAFVLSGGVVKAAAWHLGVALALQELGLTFKSNRSSSLENIYKKNYHQKQNTLEIGTYVGSSAGALVGLYLASGHSPDEVINATLNSKNTSLRRIRYQDILSLRSPVKRPPPGHKTKFYHPFDGLPFVIQKIFAPITHISGLFTTTGLCRYLEEYVLNIKSFEEFNPDVFIVATQLDNSRKVIFGKYNYPNPGHDSTARYYTGIPIIDAAAASMSVPPFYSPYPIRNPLTSQIDYYIDGEIRETLSTHVAIDNDCEYIISSWTHTPYHYHDEIGSLIHYGLPAICIQAIYLLIQKKIVDSRAQRTSARDIINTVNEYCKSQNISQYHRQNIVSILETKLNYKPNVKLIDIYPRHEDYELFFSGFFTLRPEVTSKIVKMGYRRTIEVFQKKAWEN